MLNPDHRTLYTDALRPPPRYRFKDAVATTYSLDLETLLTVPLHLALLGAEASAEELMADGVALLEALRRTTRDITVYAQTGRLMAPRQPHVLFGLLEPVVVEAFPPSRTGAFHPKTWFIRFQKPDADEVRCRLLVLSRNLTNDRSWDLVLTLDGAEGDTSVPENEPLARFLERLPRLASRPVSRARRRQCRSLADAARRTEWELPRGFESVRFHAIGVTRKRSGWLPRNSNRLAVISPFVADAALKALIESTKSPAALIGRPEDLAALDRSVVTRFERVLTLAEKAESEDGEEPLARRDAALPTHGLHAKVYIAERRWRTHLYVGSANATNPALVQGSNVEFMAELIGKRSVIGSVDDLLDGQGLGGLLMEYAPEDEPKSPDPQVVAAEERLEEVRRLLGRAGLTLTFVENPDGDWTTTLSAPRPLDLSELTVLRAWLVTRQPAFAADGMPLAAGERVAMPSAPLALLTSFVVFELAAEHGDEPQRFVLSVETRGLPLERRDAAIVRNVIRNRDGFLRYLMLLLAEAQLDAGAWGTGGGGGMPRRPPAPDDLLPVFEHLTRAYCHDPKRLDSIDKLLAEIGPRTGGSADGDVVPEDFRRLWSAFRQGTAEEQEAAS